MEKNLCVPMLMVVAFVAILASLFAGPLTEDDSPVIDAYLGEELQFGYVSDRQLTFVSDDGVTIRHAGLSRTLLGDGDLYAFTASISIIRTGFHTVLISDGSDLYQVALRISVHESGVSPPSDGPRNITSEIGALFGQYRRIAQYDRYVDPTHIYVPWISVYPLVNDDTNR